MSHKTELDNITHSLKYVGLAELAKRIGREYYILTEELLRDYFEDIPIPSTIPKWKLVEILEKRIGEDAQWGDNEMAVEALTSLLEDIENFWDDNLFLYTGDEDLV